MQIPIIIHTRVERTDMPLAAHAVADFFSSLGRFGFAEGACKCINILYVQRSEAVCVCIKVLTCGRVLSDFMAMLSDPGAFTKGAEKRDEAMKGLGIEQTDAKADAKKKEEEERKKRGIIYIQCI